MLLYKEKQIQKSFFSKRKIGCPKLYFKSREARKWKKGKKKKEKKKKK